MRTMTSICRGLASGLLALIVSSLAFVGASIAFARMRLHERFGVDDDVCWLALTAGPALIVVIHRGLHHRASAPIAALIGGLVLAGVGVMQYVGVQAAQSRHVPFGPFSGIEHVFALVSSVFVIMVAVLAVLAGGLALTARYMSRCSEPDAGGKAGPPSP